MWTNKGFRGAWQLFQANQNPETARSIFSSLVLASQPAPIFIIWKPWYPPPDPSLRQHIFCFNMNLPGPPMITLTAWKKKWCVVLWIQQHIILFLSPWAIRLLHDSIYLHILMKGTINCFPCSVAWPPEKPSIWSQFPVGEIVLYHIYLNQSLPFRFWLRMLHCKRSGYTVNVRVFHTKWRLNFSGAHGFPWSKRPCSK